MARYRYRHRPRTRTYVSSTSQQRPTRGARRRHSAASSGPNVCAQRKTVRAETSMPRSANRSRTLTALRRKAKYHRTAVTTTSRGHCSRANGVAERSVNVRRQALQRRRCTKRSRPSFLVRVEQQCGHSIGEAYSAQPDDAVSSEQYQDSRPNRPVWPESGHSRLAVAVSQPAAVRWDP